KIGFMLFDDLEELDLAGPWEVFGTTDIVLPGSTSQFTIGACMDPVRCNKGLRILPDLPFDETPDLDLLIVPGGLGTREAMKDPGVLGFLRTRHPITARIASVCTGAFLLAEAGLLNGREATTHWRRLDELRAYSGIRVRGDLRYVDEGDLLSSGGVACGIDMSLHIVRSIYGESVAGQVAKAMCHVAPPRDVVSV
ncbi:MAG: DJ-1/PfpI family protein, partial [Myxococcota bacterium]